ncbi:MAG TPA: PaaI family thioesterase [Rubricoccaceae bacterium]|jgi:uncharacterized protein (TIGR00369 family)
MSVPTNPRFAEIVAAMRASGAGGLKLPPPVFEAMQTDVQDYRPGDAKTHVGALMVARFPLLEQHQNPMGHMQGGMIAAAVDNVVGPLSYLVAPPSATANLSVTYLAPVTPDLPYVEVTARLTHRAGRQLVFEATVTGPDGQTLAVAHATQTIVRRAAT